MNQTKNGDNMRRCNAHNHLGIHGAKGGTAKVVRSNTSRVALLS
ncbi:Uncharacterised protein [Mycobacteroides abscessus subsp. abscessus]|nr:Uncharacterised protein [Mycobacteroides abscessus subsp. abscessus]